MSKKTIVISLGGSLIIPSETKEVNYTFLKGFRKILLKNKEYKFVVVTGGGYTARAYINSLKKENKSEKLQSLIGIAATRLNARFMSYFFNSDQDEGIPHTLESVEKYLKKQNIVFCGALEYKTDQTSDATAAQIANHLSTSFINLTNVSGLYNKNPAEFHDAKLIPEISWENFLKRTNQIKYHPGQHFVLDQTAAEIIKRHKIKTFILGKNLKNLTKLLNNKKFVGTTISN